MLDKIKTAAVAIAVTVALFATLFLAVSVIKQVSNKPKEPAVATKEDWLVHPETTKYEKWQKMTPHTRDALLAIYIANQEECLKHITETNGVTVGEAAILFLFDQYRELLELQKARKDAVDKRARNILGIDDPPAEEE